MSRARAPIAALASGCAWLASCGPPSEPSRAPAGAAGPVRAASFVGREACRQCHERELEAWTGSHHDLAIQEASDATVLGDFDGASLTHFGTTTSFSRRDGAFVVRTEGPDGEPAEYEVAYSFGVEPLQQYLLPLPGGRYQALSVAWDARPAAAGGQRWFHLYPDEAVPSGDELHWTGPNHNWNSMCAECHSTDLRKGYRPEQDAYQTTWSELDVSCEACHGPASAHVAWAEGRPAGEPVTEGETLGLLIRLGVGEPDWTADPVTGKPRRDPPLQDRLQVETCARCHSRRALIGEPYLHGRPLLDTHRPALLSPPLYHADGQILEEVYVYGSFLQSRMYRQGVTCSDCHDPHSLSVYTSGNALCNRCHEAARLDTPDHHHHRADSEGARCVECHMPEREYMVVDPRRDHSLRVPRPDLTVSIGTPNACQACHRERSAEWAAAAAARWWGEPGGAHYGELLHAAREGIPGSAEGLYQLAGDREQPAIVRATALAMLRGAASPAALSALGGGLRSREPLIRLGALQGLELPDARARLAAAALLDDPVRAVRTEAARILSGIARELLPAERRAALERAIGEYEAAQRLNAERPEAALNLGLLYAQLGRLGDAEREYRRGLERQASFLPLYVNLADLYRAQGRDQEGEAALRRGLRGAPDNPELLHSLGLLLVRRGRLDEALTFLERSAALRPGEPRYGYVLGVALEAAGRAVRALEVLERARQSHPADRELLVALASISRKHGRATDALGYARELVRLAPQDPAARQLLRELQAELR